MSKDSNFVRNPDHASWNKSYKAYEKQRRAWIKDHTGYCKTCTATGIAEEGMCYDCVQLGLCPRCTEGAYGDGVCSVCKWKPFREKEPPKFLMFTCTFTGNDAFPKGCTKGKNGGPGVAVQRYTGPNMFCSHECFAQFKTGRPVADDTCSKISAHHWKRRDPALGDVECLWCHKITPRKATRQLYCPGYSCASNARREKLKGRPRGSTTAA